jgi:hypothetical protein
MWLSKPMPFEPVTLGLKFAVRVLVSLVVLASVTEYRHPSVLIGCGTISH